MKPVGNKTAPVPKASCTGSHDATQSQDAVQGQGGTGTQGQGATHGGCPYAGGRIEIEAAWAPQDPRDNLYDPEATTAQKAGSLLRVIGAFHPVLNIPVLIYRSAVNFGWVKALILWLFLGVALVLIVRVLSV